MHTMITDMDLPRAPLRALYSRGITSTKFVLRIHPLPRRTHQNTCAQYPENFAYNSRNGRGELVILSTESLIKCHSLIPA